MVPKFSYELLDRSCFNPKEAKYLSKNLGGMHIESFLKKRNWHTWYNKDYWVSKKVIADKSEQDYTDYGLNKEDAFMFEILDIKPVENKLGISQLNLKLEISSQTNE